MKPWHPSRFPPGAGQLRWQRTGAVVEVVLDNPGARNAVCPGMMVALEALVCELEASDALGVILRGEGSAAFCAGGDLGSVAEHLMEPGAGAGMCGFMTGVLNRLSRAPQLVVAAVEGAALGGGAELLTAADVVIAGESARIGFVQATLAVSPGWGGGARLVEKVGRGRAVQWLALAQLHSASRAAALGLVDQVVPDGTALAAARALLAPLDTLEPRAVRAALRIGRGASAEEEAEAFAGLWGGPAHQEAMARIGRRRR